MNGRGLSRSSNGADTVRFTYIFLMKHGTKNCDLAEINRLGASYENADDKVYAVDCEPEIAVGPVVDYLSQLKDVGVINFRISEC